jgi:Zn-dependent protease
VYQDGSMFPSYRLGSILGFPIRVNLTFLILLGVILLWAGGVGGVVVALLTFGSVLLHELGHALVARRLGVRVASIDLHFFGGAARMADSSSSPRDEIAIAAAGPAVSFALAGVSYLLSGFGQLFWVLAVVNLMLGAFNLLPAFPSDGGRILRALLARRRGLMAATDLAVKVSRVVCIGLAVVGVAIGSYQLALVAAVLWTMGTAERLMVRMRGGGPDWQQPGREPEVVYLPPDQVRAERSGWSPRPTGRPPRIVYHWRP